MRLECHILTYSSSWAPTTSWTWELALCFGLSMADAFMHMNREKRERFQGRRVVYTSPLYCLSLLLYDCFGLGKPARLVRRRSYLYRTAHAWIFSTIRLLLLIELACSFRNEIYYVKWLPVYCVSHGTGAWLIKHSMACLDVRLPVRLYSIHIIFYVRHGFYCYGECFTLLIRGLRPTCRSETLMLAQGALKHMIKLISELFKTSYIIICLVVWKLSVSVT